MQGIEAADFNPSAYRPPPLRGERNLRLCLRLQDLRSRGGFYLIFSNPVFLFLFLTSVFLLYRITPGIKAKNGLLIVFSLAFYTYGEPVAIFVMLISIVLTYIFGLIMAGNSKRKKFWLIVSVVLNLGILSVFKYTGFAAELLNCIPGVALSAPKSIFGIAGLPIGISFYTFQAISYVVDSYKEPSTAQRNIFKVMLYVTFFPQLVAGPIIKYHDFKDLIDKRQTTPQMTAEGMRRFIIGLSKKLIIADRLLVTADFVYGLDTAKVSAPLAWLGAAAYMLQIFFDFSAYSDMAIGLASMFGFTFKENFNYPYISGSVQEFWRRWHISLSTWFKEYLYIPLGGNRKGKGRTAVNKLIVFFSTGLWHGASLNFIVWGLLNGIFMMLEGLKQFNPAAWFKPFRHIYTLLVTLLMFVFFRADNLKDACSRIGRMFGGGNANSGEGLSLALRQFTPVFIFTLLLAVVFCMPVWRWIEHGIRRRETGVRLKAIALGDALSYVVTLGLLLLCIITMASSTYKAFIYLRF